MATKMHIQKMADSQLDEVEEGNPAASSRRCCAGTGARDESICNVAPYVDRSELGHGMPATCRLQVPLS